MVTARNQGNLRFRDSVITIKSLGLPFRGKFGDVDNIFVFNLFKHKLLSVVKSCYFPLEELASFIGRVAVIRKKHAVSGIKDRRRTGKLHRLCVAKHPEIQEVLICIADDEIR